jgi:hypothetical protein
MGDRRTEMFKLMTDDGRHVGTAKAIKKYGAGDWRAAPSATPGYQVHEQVQAKMRALGIKSYSEALAKVLSDPKNAALKREFARQP